MMYLINFLFSHSVLSLASIMFIIISESSDGLEKFCDMNFIISFPGIHFLLLGLLC